MAKLTTKIISGKFKNMVLDLPSTDTTRSSKSILKESFFNVLQYDVIDTIFIEAFGGSGSIGLEALSRGALKSYFVEKDKKSFAVLTKNCRKLDEKNSVCFLDNSFDKTPKILEKYLDTNDEIVLYLDPPFDIRDKMEGIYEQTFNLIKNIKNDNIILITIEHMTSLEIPNEVGKFEKTKTKKFGRSSLSYYKPKNTIS